MAKWNPFGKKILNADPEEFAGSQDAGYGVPHDADIEPHGEGTGAQGAGEGGKDSLPAGGWSGDGSAQDAPGLAGDFPGQDMQDSSIRKDGPDLSDNSFGQNAQDSPVRQDVPDLSGNSFGQDTQDSPVRQDASGMSDNAIPHDTPDSFSGQEMPGAAEGSFGQNTPDRPFGQDAVSGSFDQNAAGMPGGSFGQEASGRSSGQDTPGVQGGSFGQPRADEPEDFFAHAPASSIPNDSSGPVPSGPNGPSGPDHSVFGPKHDFEDDEPKYDTQTGERLDKPKKKFPAMLLTVAVTAVAVGTFIYAVKPGALPSRKEVVEEPVETETHSAAVQAETQAHSAAAQAETQALSAAAQSETQALSNAAKSESEKLSVAAQAESEAEGKAKIQAGQPETESLTKADARTETKGQTEVRQTEARQAGALRANKGKRRTEAESETETEITSRIPPFTTDGITVSASLDVSDMVEEVMPGIVSVTCSSVQNAINFFYGAEEIRQTDAGSGIIVDQDEEYLYLVTDAGIVNGAKEITVGFCVQKDQTEDLADDDTLAAAELVGIDQDSMLAVLRVPLDGIHETVRSLVGPSRLGDSDTLRVGEKAFAIGNAMGRGLSVTQGIISAVKRPLRYGTSVHDFIQTDASINYGNYGGALLNDAGEVIGVNVGMNTGVSSEGMGFAIPVNDAKDVIIRLLPSSGLAVSEEKKAEEETEERTEEKAEEAVEETEEKSEAKAEEETEEKAQEETEEKTAEKADSEETSSSETGTKKDKDQRETLALALAEEQSEAPSSEKESPAQSEKENPAQSEKENAAQSEKDIETLPQTKESGQENAQTEGISQAVPQAEGSLQAPSQGQLGIQVGEFSKEDQIIYRIPAGAVVAQVTEGSGAQAAGLATGDLIIRINEEDISSVIELKEALEGLKGGDKVLVTFLRPDEEGTYRKEDALSVMVTLQGSGS